LSVKKREGRKINEKNEKTVCETAERVNQTILIVGGASMSEFIVEG